MPQDLHQIDLQDTSPAALYAAIESFTAVNLPLDQRPREGYLLEFKQEWNEAAVHTVAAFANTFGGLMILGVEEEDGRPASIVGVSYKGELKTRVASSIASNIVPCPSFEVGECALPNDVDKKLCVVRVGESPEMCLITKKGEGHPVRVRVEDLSPPADAAQLRDLIQRKARRQELDSNFHWRRDRWLAELFVTKKHPSLGGQRTRSDTYMSASLFPLEHPPIEIDIGIERRFFDIVNETFRGLDNRDMDIQLGPRSRDSYRIRRLDPIHDLERQWAFNSFGDIGFATQTAWGDKSSGRYWSLCDLILDLSFVLAAAREFWKSFGYYGKSRLIVQVGVRELDLRFDGQGFHPILYDPWNPIARNAVFISPNPNEGGVGGAEVDVSFQTDLVHLIAIVVNQLLRYLGHTADLDELQQSISATLPPRLRGQRSGA